MNRHRRGDAEHLKDASEHLAVLDAHLQPGSFDDVLIRDAVSERCFSRQYKMRSPLGWPFDRLRARG